MLVLEEKHTRQALRYMATADNVVKSGHFRVGKDIPEMTMSHLMGWCIQTVSFSLLKVNFIMRINLPMSDCY